MMFVTPSASSPRRRVHRRLLQIIQTMLRTLARPLVLARRVPRRIKVEIEQGNVGCSIGILVGEMTGAARALARRLRTFGFDKVGELWGKARGRRRHSWAHAPGWIRSFAAACQGCGKRLCGVFQHAQSLEDRTIAGLAYGLLRTLEKELSILRYQRPWA